MAVSKPKWSRYTRHQHLLKAQEIVRFLEAFLRDERPASIPEVKAAIRELEAYLPYLDTDGAEGH
jgi:hypothetical protein